MIGSRVQQTCSACAEKAVEAVRNGKGGTRPGPWQVRAEGRQRLDDHVFGHGPNGPRSVGKLACREWTHRAYVDGGDL
jgi:hypothetical protein